MDTPAHSGSQQFFSAISWNLLLQLIQRGLGIVSGIILIRLLTPGDFGLLGVLGIFLALATLLTDGGFGNALLRRKVFCKSEYSSVFYYNVCSSCCFYLILFFCAPLIAAFYNNPMLIPVTRWVGIIIPLGGLASIQNLILQQQLNYRLLTIIGGVNFTVTTLLALLLAFLGYGIWALVAQQLVGAVLNCILSWSVVRWCPELRFNWNELKKLLGFGSKILATSFINSITENIYSILIGRNLSLPDVGFYSKSFNYATLVPLSLGRSLTQVSLPALAKIQDDRPLLRNSFFRAMSVAVAVVFPLSVLIAFFSRPFTELVLTPDWLPIIPLLRILSLAFLFTPVQIMNSQILVVTGQAGCYLKLEILKKGVTILLLIATLNKGLIGIAWGQLIAALFCVTCNLLVSQFRMNYPILQQLKIILLYGALSVLCGGMGWLFFLLLEPFHPWAGFIGGGGIAIAGYLLAGVMFHISAFEEGLVLFEKRFHSFARIMKFMRESFLLKRFYNQKN